MDRTRINKPIEPKRPGKGHGQGVVQGHRQVESSFFGNTRPKRQYFSIHPEWVSENFSVQPISINKRMSAATSGATNGTSGMSAASATSLYPAERRCKSAPPRTRNPITWENPDINEQRSADLTTEPYVGSLRDLSLRAGRGRTTKRPKSEVMDAIGTNNVDKQKQGAKFNIKSPFFATTKSPRRQYYTIHPEWQSESGQVRKLTSKYTDRTICMTLPPRRCKSAPPPLTRNPITWTNADRPDRR